MELENLAPGSKLVIGGYDIDQFTPKNEREIYWLDCQNIDFASYWQVATETNSVYITYGPDQYQSIQSKSRGLVLDSGTSFIITPVEDFNNILDMFQNDHGVVF